MRRLLVAGLGCGLALSPSFARAQTPRSPVRIVGVRATDEPLHLARAQANSPMPMPGTPIPKPMPSPMPSPMATPGGPMGSSTAPPTPLGMPTPFGGGPNVLDQPGTAYPAPGVTLGPAWNPSPELPYSGMPYPAAPYPQSGGPEAYGGAGFPQLDAPLYEGCYSNPAAGGYGSYPGAPAYAGYDPAYGQPGFAGILGGYGPYGGPNRWSLSGEFLLWFTKSAQFPALLSTSSPGFNGILGNGDSRVILGNGSFGDTLHGGGRFTASRKLGGADLWTLNGSVFVLDNRRTEFVADSTRYPVLARPFTNANQNIPFAQVLAAPGLAVGSANVTFENMVWGAELDLRRRLTCNACSRLDFIGGFRYLNVSDELGITESFVRTPNSPTSIGVPNAVSGTVFDSIRTENHFYGGTVGLAYERRRGRWFTNLTGKVSLGQMEEQVTINGTQTITFDNGAIGRYAGGLLAVPGANIGTFSQNRFAVVPEIGFNLGYYVTRHCRAFVGYNFLYISNILRPGEQIDQAIDITRIPNFPVANVSPLALVRPGVPLKEASFFAQGVSFGLEWKW